MPYILDLADIKSEHKNIIGNKAYSLSLLSSYGLPINKGFVITSLVQKEFIKQNELDKKIKKQLDIFDLQNPQQVLAASQQIQNIIKTSQFPKEIATQIFDNLDLLTAKNSKSIALRTSLIKDSYNLPHPLFLNVDGEHTLIELVKESYAKLITPLNLHQNKDLYLPLGGIIVQLMFNSSSSGFLHTIDPYTHNKRIYVIEAVWGLAEILQNQDINRDKYCLDKQNYNITLRKTYPQQVEQTIKDNNINQKAIPFSKQLLPKLNDKQIKILGTFAHKAAKITPLPQTLEWGFDGKHFSFFQTQSLIENEQINNNTQEKILNLPIIIEGNGANPGMGHGTLVNCQKLSQSFSGEIVILSEYDPQLLDYLKYAEGIINFDSQNQREIKFFCQQEGIPLINAHQSSLSYLKAGIYVTIDGSTGYVYKGSFANHNQDFSYEREITIEPLNPVFTQIPAIITKTKIYTNFDNHDQFSSFDPDLSDGICLIKGEDLLLNLGIHPYAFLAQDKENIIIELFKKQLYYLKDYPPDKPVFYRFSDLQSSLLFTLSQAHEFENIEGIPLLGLRGSLRHMQQPKLLATELKSIKNLFKQNQLNLVLPFFRINEELSFLINKLQKTKSIDQIKLWINIASAANCINIPQYLTNSIEGVIVDMQQLSRLTLGVDPFNPKTVNLYNEFDPAILWLLQRLIHYLSNKKLKVILNNFYTPLDHQRLSMLLKMGINGIGISPQSVLETKKIVANIEKDNKD